MPSQTVSKSKNVFIFFSESATYHKTSFHPFSQPRHKRWTVKTLSLSWLQCESIESVVQQQLDGLWINAGIYPVGHVSARLWNSALASAGSDTRLLRDGWSFWGKIPFWLTVKWENQWLNLKLPFHSVTWQTCFNLFFRGSSCLCLITWELLSLSPVTKHSQLVTRHISLVSYCSCQQAAHSDTQYEWWQRCLRVFLMKRNLIVNQHKR